MKNAMQLKAIIKNLAKEKHISAQLVMQNFMLERLLERISISKYQQNFILKDGFLIAAMVGLDTRATMDMDATIKGLPVNEQTVREMFEEICKIELEDDVTFSFRSIGEIREGDVYTGYRVSLSANYPPMAVPLKLDIITGDKITPKEIEYQFKSEEDYFDDLIGYIGALGKWSIFKKRPKKGAKAEYIFFDHTDEEQHIGFQFILTGLLSVHYDETRNFISRPGFTAFPSYRNCNKKYVETLRRDVFPDIKEEIFQRCLEIETHPKRIWEYNHIVGYIVIGYEIGDILFKVYLPTPQKQRYMWKTSKKTFLYDIHANGTHFRVDGSMSS